MEVWARCSRPVLTAVAVLLCTSLPCRASNEQHPAGSDPSDLDAQVIAQLELKASQANPREQCYLYVQVVQTMVDEAGHQMLAGDSDRAAATLKQTQHYTQLIHLALTRDTKRLKD